MGRNAHLMNAMNPFEKATFDIFNNEDFTETCVIGNVSYICICSSLNDTMSFGEAGLVDEADFTLEIKLPLSNEIKRGEKVVFRSKTYKVSEIETDSANASVKIILTSLSKG